MTRDRFYGWLVIITAAIAVTFGLLWRMERVRVAAYQDQSACLQVIREEGTPYTDVVASVSSHPKAVVHGTVASEAQREYLDKRLTLALGAERRTRILFAVRVR